MILMQRTLVVFLSITTTIIGNLEVSCEHKVHNIVLYPERHSWCQTTPIKQVVAMPGYEPLTIDNHVCVGACYSYSIPRTEPAEPGELIGPYCDSCQPKTTQCYHVTLRKSNSSGQDEQMRKRVQIITDCSCSSCSRLGLLAQDDCDLEDDNTAELPPSLFASKDSSQEKNDGVQEVPELMAMQPQPQPSLLHSQKTAIVDSIPENNQNNQPIRISYHLSDSLRKLLKLIQMDENFASFHNLTPELLVDMRQLVEVIQGDDGQLSDLDVVNFVNWVNEHEVLSSETGGDGEDAMDLEAIRLKHVLDAFHRRELKQKHRKFGLGLSLSTASDNLELQEAVVEGSHLGLGHRKGAHIGMGIHAHDDSHEATNKQLSQNIIPSGDEDDDDIADDDDAVKSQHHHHVGEAINAGGSVAHLVMGPHGSLVVAAEERLSLTSDEVVPNEEGTVIDYHHHNHHHHQHSHHRAAVTALPDTQTPQSQQ